MSKKISIKDMQELALKRNGTCLSKEYINARTHLLWKCHNQEHQPWKATPNKIKSGRWCPKCGREECANKQKGTIEQMRNLAIQKNGKCLSDIYTNNRSKLLWECKKAHKWYATSDHIKSGSWCPQCGIERRANLRRSSIEDMHKVAKKFSGQCLSDVYINSKTKLAWKCAKGHVFRAQPNNVSYGKWCPLCKNEKTALRSRIPFVKIIQIIEEKGGECLTLETDYVGGQSNLLIKCKEGHIWSSKAVKIRHGGWCPVCSVGFNERKCNFIFEELLGIKFIKDREVLGGYELDGFNEEQKIAFEYHGVQHYEYIEFFHKEERQFKEQKQKDRMKRKMCKEKGIKLITVPYTVANNDELFVKFIVHSLKKLNIFIANNNIIDFKKLNQQLSELKKLNSIAQSHGGKCLSNTYLGSETKLRWECSKGHIWETIPYLIKNGSWCPTCRKGKLSIEQMKEIAIEKGGKCLSDSYINNTSSLIWECSKGHVWKAPPRNVRAGSWCFICNHPQRLSIQHAQEIANLRGGKCLSTTYINSESKLTWCCSEGHIWNSVITSIKKGHWCPKCGDERAAKSRKLTIQDAQEIANLRGGECLSTTYINSKSKLTWCCSEGHIWNSVITSIKSGTWCPTCSGTVKLSIQDIQKYAKKNTGECLSTYYKNNREPLKWKCLKCDSSWELSYDKMKRRKNWCKQCKII
ncbi:zinc-ribbon domain-containing protein [Bacillus mycoides]|uniref:zinc-ribbon domain-containing protein n=1 Tax=Bacillus mycoides TaxID=1405 RepID=UPI001C035258|nr:zinc-ribbon domain-containing protein [Bacillus mycoides]